METSKKERLLEKINKLQSENSNVRYSYTPGYLKILKNCGNTPVHNSRHGYTAPKLYHVATSTNSNINYSKIALKTLGIPPI
jgi:hypothetical protein